MPLESAKPYWALAIAGSFLLHAGAVGAAVALIDNSPRESIVTEISFSETLPDTAAVAARSSEIFAASNRAEPANRAFPAVQQLLEPSKPTVAAMAEQVRARPTSTAVAAPTVAATTTAIARETPVVSLQPQPAVPAPAGQPLGVAETIAAVALPSVAPDAVASAATLEDIAPTSAPLAGRVQAGIASSAPSEALRPASTAMAGIAAAPAGAPDIAASSPGAAAVASGGVEPQRLQPAAPSGSLAGNAPAILPPVATANAPVAGSTEVAALLVPARPGSSLGSETDRPSDRYRDVIKFIRNFDGGNCFVALPAIDADGSVEFQTFGKDKAREGQFAGAYAGALGISADVSLGNVADAQCRALSFARGLGRYPAFSLIIELDAADVTSGSALSGAILNVMDRPVHLLLIDDEGRVQAMDRFLSRPNGADRKFSTPLTLTGGPVATKQLLLAIAADRELATLDGRTNEPAAEFFARLAAEIMNSGADIDIALEAFGVF